MEGKTFSIGQALSFGWKAATGRIGYWIGLIIVSVVIIGIPGAITQALNDQGSGWAALFNLIGYVLQLWIGIGWLRISLMTADGKRPSLGELFAGFKDGLMFGRYVLAAILVGLMVTVGFLLLIIPGVILGLKYGYYAYFIIDKRVAVLQSIKMSGLATKGNLWNLFLFALAGIGITILGAIPLGLGLFVTVPMLAIAQAFIYRQLSSGVAIPTAPVMPAASAAPTAPQA